MSSPLPPHVPRMPSRRASAILAALVLAAGIAAGAAIGPGPATSLAAATRASALARVLALLAVGSGTDASSGALLAATAIHPPPAAPQPTPAPSAASTAGGTAKSPHGTSSATHGSSSTSSLSTGSRSPAPSTSPTKGGGSGEKTTTPLPPIAQVWLIALPYGQSLANAVAQTTAAPYLDGQLVEEGTQLTAYSSLAAGQLAGAAALLSGQVAAGVTSISPPPCAGSAAPAPQGTAGAQGTTGAPCPAGEPAGVQAADAFLRQAVAQITATAAYREHGLIAITFVAPGQEGAASTGSSTAPATSATGPAISYPGGTVTSTLTAAGQPAGALLLSPFLRHAGGRIATTFNPLSPRESLEGLLGVHPG